MKGETKRQKQLKRQDINSKREARARKKRKDWLRYKHTAEGL